MASLKKPVVCSKCRHEHFEHLFSPEQWVCLKCGHIGAERPTIDNTKCRECGAKRGTTPFKPGKNICVGCGKKIHKEWSEKNREKLRAKQRTPEARAKRNIAVRKAAQKSPEGFIKHLIVTILKPSYRKARSKKLVIEIDFDYLWGLWETQNGLCAITGVGMTHKFKNLRSISIDRIDSDEGYIPGNVQLVCKAANHAKGDASQEDVLEFFRTVAAVAYGEIS